MRLGPLGRLLGRRLCDGFRAQPVGQCVQNGERGDGCGALGGGRFAGVRLRRLVLVGLVVVLGMVVVGRVLIVMLGRVLVMWMTVGGGGGLVALHARLDVVGGGAGGRRRRWRQQQLVRIFDRALVERSIGAVSVGAGA